MLLRNIPTSDAPAPARPADVGPRVDDAALVACLRAGRPEGDEGLITVRGVGCPTITTGSATTRPVLCVHGLGHDAWDWAPFFVRCKNVAAVTAFDLPGFGLADKPATPDGGRWDMTVFVDALLAAAALAPSPPAVVASSLGAHIAIVAALREPRAFSKLVLAAPGGLVDVPGHMQAILRGYYAVDAIVGRKEDEIVKNSHRIFSKGGLALDDALAARKLAVHRSQRAREFAVPFAGIVDDVFRHVIFDRMPELRVPTLILSGARDVVVPPDVCALAARRMGCRFVSFPEVGHCPHLEAPDAFADTVMGFILGGQ